MDKVIINNQVVLMRKFVKQAKIRAINNYTKEVRKLQNRKGNEEGMAKHKRKAERFLSKVAILKKIDPDIVSRKALSKEKDWKAVLKEKNIPLEDQCYALLANYAGVQSEVERFHKKYWDLAPKIAIFFKDWEEQSKDPMTKQQKKKAKLLRKSMKNVKLGKDNPNAIPIGLRNDAETIQDKNIPNKKTTLNPSVNKGNAAETKEATAKQIKNKLSKKITMPKVLPSAGVISEEKSSGKNDETFINENDELSGDEKDEAFGKQSDEASGCEMDETSSNKNDEASSNKSDEASDKESNEASGNESDEGSGNKSDEGSENKSDEGSENKSDEGSENKSDEASANKSQNIQERLKAMAHNHKKDGTKINWKHNFNSKVDSCQKSVSNNNLKAVRMLNLNELHDLDEIEIEKASDIMEETGQRKQKKDSFFLGKGGEVPSESDEEDSANQVRGMNRPAFKKRKFENFDRELLGGDSFKKRKFPTESSSNFRENNFQRNKRSSNFEDRNNSFKNREHQSFDYKGKGFQNKSFDAKNHRMQFKQNSHSASKNREHFQKNKLSDSLSKSNMKPLDDKPLHPSWEAKKKLKEASKSKYQGKRIVFDN